MSGSINQVLLTPAIHRKWILTLGKIQKASRLLDIIIQLQEINKNLEIPAEKFIL